jgi:hypothetical protein
MLTYTNHLGLYSEEIARTGEQIGNFPQAFTHRAMIDAAITLDTKLDLAAPHTAASSSSIFSSSQRSAISVESSAPVTGPATAS